MVTLTFEIESWWHAGTGRGGGAVADAVVNRSAEGLPYLPGRSIKGLLRAAMQTAEDCGRVPKGRTEELFGSQLPASEEESDDKVKQAFEEARFTTRPGMLHFSSATLGDDWRAWAQGAAEAEKRHLFHTLSSTAIGDDGMVADRTLRTVEVSLPMTLTATVTGPPSDQSWQKDLRTIAPLVRSLGAQRNRGFGRVHLTVR